MMTLPFAFANVCALPTSPACGPEVDRGQGGGLLRPHVPSAGPPTPSVLSLLIGVIGRRLPRIAAPLLQHFSGTQAKRVFSFGYRDVSLAGSLECFGR
jgi:hypothetical protein